MTEFLDIIKYALPPIVVLVSAVFIIQIFFRAYFNKKRLAVKGEVSVKTIQIRLQAYERIVLFLERISPQQLVLRVDVGEMDIDRYHRILLHTVREEFEHNIAQQIYISAEAWDLVKSAKESVVQLINKSRNELKEGAPALDLASKIVEINMLEGSKQMDGALSFIKKEVMGLF
jgi:hypothetical protein